MEEYFDDHMEVFRSFFSTGRGQSAVRLMESYMDYDEVRPGGLMKWVSPDYDPSEYEEISIEDFAGVDSLTELGRTGFEEIDNVRVPEVIIKAEPKPVSAFQDVIEAGIRGIVEMVGEDKSQSKIVEQYEQVLSAAFNSLIPSELPDIKVGFSQVTDWFNRRLNCDLTRKEELGEAKSELDRVRMMLNFGLPYKELAEQTFDRMKVKEMFERVGIVSVVDQDAVFDGGTSSGLAFCIPPTEGKTTLANKEVDVFEDCDTVFHRAMEMHPGFMVGIPGSHFERMYRRSAYLARDRDKVLLTQSPKCVPGGVRFYSFVLCCCDGVHPHVENGVRKFSINPLHAYHRGRIMEEKFPVVFFSSFNQRDMAVRLLTDIYLHEMKLREFVVEKYHKQMFDFD
jgi:hypothetical protein